MKKYFFSCLFVLLSLFAFSACEEKDPADLLPSKTPEIKWEEVKPMQVSAYQDSIHFAIRYTDGDGDLGSSNPDAQNLILTDTRLPEAPFYYRIQQLAPETEEGVPITGIFRFSLAQTVLLSDQASEQTTFTVQVIDRAGNESNLLKTTTITILRE